KMALNGLGLSIVITGSHGKMTATANGRPIDPAQTPFGDTGLGQMLGKPVVMQMTPAGEITQVEGLPQSGTMQLPGMNMQHLFTGGVVLPDHPVAPGDSWTSKSSTPVPMPNGQTAQMQTTLASTLKSLVAQGAHTIATIETKGTVA